MTREDLLRRIREVFPDPIWPKHKLAAVSDSGDLDCQYIIEHYQGKRWTELTREELGWASQDAHNFTDSALTYFFPAWLAADVNDPDHAWQVENIAFYAPPTLTENFSAEQRFIAYSGLIFVYGGGDPWSSDDSHLRELIYAFSPTMTMRATPRGTITIGTVEEVHAHQLQEWREMSQQDKADLFVELMRTWRPDAPGLARTAQIVRLS